MHAKNHTLKFDAENADEQIADTVHFQLQQKQKRYCRLAKMYKSE